MEQQRRRMEERRKRLKSVKEASEKKKSDLAKYGSGGKPAVTRDTSKDKKKSQKVTRDTSKDQIRPKVKPAEKKPAVVSKPKNEVPQRFADGGKGGKYDKQEKASRTGTYGKPLPSNPSLKSQPKKTKAAPKLRSGGSRAYVKPRKKTGPKVGDTRRTRVGSRYVTKQWNGDKWVTKK